MPQVTAILAAAIDGALGPWSAPATRTLSKELLLNHPIIHQQAVNRAFVDTTIHQSVLQSDTLVVQLNFLNMTNLSLPPCASLFVNFQCTSIFHCVNHSFSFLFGGESPLYSIQWNLISLFGMWFHCKRILLFVNYFSENTVNRSEIK